MKNLVLSCLESRVESNNSLYGRFLLAPFKNGNALTMGTTLRRALLSQIEGLAITALDIQGITHEFSTIAGVRESVLELSLNFQRIVLRDTTKLKKVQVGYLQIQGPAVVYANDLKLPRGVECVDPTQYIATLSRDGLLVVKFLIATSTKKYHLRKNNSLLTANQILKAKKMLFKETQNTNTQEKLVLSNQCSTNEAKELKPGLINTKFFNSISNKCLQNIIPLDVFVAPVNKVNFVIQTDDLSVGARERLLLEIWTNGSIQPRQAIHSAVLSLITLFSEFRNFIHLDSHSVEIKKGLQSELQINLNKRLSFLYKSNLDKTSLLSSDLNNLSLSLKTYSFLKQKGINKLDTLLQTSSRSLLQLVNGNKYMFYEIKRCIFVLGLQLKES